MTGTTAPDSASCLRYPRSARFRSADRNPVKATIARLDPKRDVHSIWPKIAGDGAVVR
jgi:hypothetical protein